MKSYPLVFVGQCTYSFKDIGSDSQVAAAQRLSRRIKASNTLVAIMVSSKG